MAGFDLTELMEAANNPDHPEHDNMMRTVTELMDGAEHGDPHLIGLFAIAAQAGIDAMSPGT